MALCRNRQHRRLDDSTESKKPNRREFLGAAGAAVMTAASYRRVIGANDRVGIGVIGFGLIGKQHIADLKKFKDVELLGMCDCYKPRLDEGLAYMESPNAKGYSDFRRMYENKDIQGVVIAYAGSLACHAHHPGLRRREGRLRREADDALRRRRQVDGPGRPQVQPHRRRRARSGGTAAACKDARNAMAQGTIGKVHSIRWSSYRNIYPGFGVTPVTNPPPELDYDMWLGPAEKKPYRAHRALYHFRWFWDFSGGQMTNLGAHTIDQIMYVMNVKGPTLVHSTGGRFVLEDDGDTPDIQDAMWVFPSSTPGAPISS